MRVGFIEALTCIAAGLGGCGCGLSCDAVGCSSSVTLELSEPLTEPGEYVFTLRSAATTLTCAAVVPLSGDDSSECDGDLFVGRERISATVGGALGSRPGDAIESVSLLGEPRTVFLAVTRDGTEIINVEVSPNYDEVEINGPGCGTCTMGRASISN